MPAFVPDCLRIIVVELCEDSRGQQWYRVHSVYKYRGVCISELSIGLARRILPRWLTSLGIEGDEQAGLFAGRVFCPNCTSYAL